MSDKSVRNCSIDIFRYVAAIMVVAIHTHPFYEINEQLGYLCQNIIPRVAVPFFFAVSGYFYIPKLSTDKTIFFKYIKKLFFPYFICSCFYYLIDFINGMATGNLSISSFFSTSVSHLFIGSHYHLWFFPALIFSVILATLMYKLEKCTLITLSILLYLIGCLSWTYSYIGMQIPVLRSLIPHSFYEHIFKFLLMGFPFFVCGYVVYILQKYTRPQYVSVCFFICVIIYLAEMIVAHHYDLSHNTTISISLYPLVITTLLMLLQHPALKLKKASQTCKMLANFTYYFHPAFITLITFSGTNLFHLTITETSLFILTLLLTFLIGLITSLSKNQYINKIIS